MASYWVFRWITWFLVVVFASLVINMKWPLKTEPDAYWIAFAIFVILGAIAFAALDEFARKLYHRVGK